MTKTLEEIEAQVTADADKASDDKWWDDVAADEDYLKEQAGRDEEKRFWNYKQSSKRVERARPTEVEIHENACNYAEKQLLDLVHSLSTDRAFHHFNKNWPHEYVSDIMGKLNEIRADIRARQGTPGFGKLK